MTMLSIDIETYSNVDLIKCGVYAYADSPDFELLLFGYAFDGDEVQVIDVAGGEQLDSRIMDALTDPAVIKTAFNASFERVCLSRYLGIVLESRGWHCTAVQAAMLALPLSLEGVGAVLGLEKQKLAEGKNLIRYFCMPCKETKVNGGRSRNLPRHEPEKWEQFKAYCIRDVEMEQQIRKRLQKFPVPEKEQQYYQLDQQINDQGILIDRKLVSNAVECDVRYKGWATRRAYELTGLENPNSVKQLKEWLAGQGIEAESLDKKAVARMVGETDGEVKEMLQLRRDLSKTSVKKYEAIERSICRDNRVHGLLQFYGANRTGRWAGRLVQVQNLPQNHLPDLELVRELLRTEKYEEIEMLYHSTSGVLSELIRTAFVPQEGYQFLVADFSAIEARVLAWLAGETWRTGVFETHGKIYEASASAMFGINIEKITKGSSLRQKGKIAELALGYGGAAGALISMGALDMGLEENELGALVRSWRNANPNITRFWWDVDEAAIRALKHKAETKVGRIRFLYESGILFVTLPSGRRLSYVKPRLGINKFDREGITYEGIGTSRKWVRLNTYGPKLVENIVQAVSRDILAEAMMRIDRSGFAIVMHVHDEVVVEAKAGVSDIKELCGIMGEVPEWADGLPLRADGYICDFYKKD